MPDVPVIYPFGVGYQRRILAMLARDPSFVRLYRGVVLPQYFEDPVHIDLAREVIAFIDTHECLPSFDSALEIVERLCRTSQQRRAMHEHFSEEIAAIYTVDLNDLRAVQATVVDFARDQAMKQAVAETIDLLEEQRPNRFDLIHTAIERSRNIGQGLDDLGSFYFETAANRASLYQSGALQRRKVSTGSESLDRVMGGGLGAGELGCIAASAGGGKSAKLINLGAAALTNRRSVLHYTMELSAEATNRRYDVRLCSIPFAMIQSSTERLLEQLRRFQELTQARLLVKQFPPSRCTIDIMHAHLTSLNSAVNFRPDLIIVDYADLMGATRHYNENRFELASIYRELRALAVELDIPIWTATQVNRAGTARTRNEAANVVEIEDLSEAYEKAAICDVVIGLCQTREEQRNHTMRLHVAKNRDNISGVTFDFQVQYETMRFRDVTALAARTAQATNEDEQ